MTSESSSAKDVFLDAADLTQPEREAFLDVACAGQPELRQRVDALLEAHENSGDIEAPRLIPEDLQPGDRVGSYEIVSPLGEGGFGVVWRALQEKPLRRYVAIKVLKLGMDTEKVVRRFNTERQALALMDHPGIARVFDAGATQSGRPFFAMELVDGWPITEYCQREKIGLTARLQLFIAVCRALQHAHQKGIIHRDLKPSNILVTVQDGLAVPKVIDFGIAKATGAGLLQDSMLTAHDQFVGSPAYMSPEQMRVGNQDIDTRTDVYSLGVVLYEMLTGTLPFDFDNTTEDSYHQVFDRIREQDPPRPSSKITDQIERDPALFEQPQTTVLRLFQRDLDWIVMKALEKEPSRRYETASSFAADIGRFLNDEPVEASPPSLAYRFRKLTRRHRVTMITAAAVVLAILVGAGLAVVGFLEARNQARLAVERGDAAVEQEQIAREASERALEEKARAEEERDRASAVVGLLQRLLNAPSEERQRGPDYTVRELLDDFSSGIDEELRDQPGVESTIRETLGNTYLQLRLPAAARPHLVRARELKRHLLEEGHYERAFAEIDLARLLAQEGAFEEAEAKYRQYLAVLEETENVPQRRLSIAHAEMASTLAELGRYDEAGAWLAQAFEGVTDEDLLGRAILTSNLGLLAEQRGDYAAAEELYREALALHDEHELDSIEHAKVRSNLGNLQLLLGQLPEAESNMRVGLELLVRLAGEDSYLVTRARHNLGRVLTTLGNFEEAEEVLDAALRQARESYDDDHPETAAMLAATSLLYSRTGRPEEALAASQEALEIRRRAFGPDHPDLASLVFNFGSMLRDAGRQAEAMPYLEDALRIVYLNEANAPFRPRVLSELGLAHEAQGNLGLAMQYLARTYAASLEIDDQQTAGLAQQRVAGLADRFDDDLVAAECLLDVGLPDAAGPRARSAHRDATTSASRDRANIARGRVAALTGEFEEGEDRVLGVWLDLGSQGDAELRRRAAQALVELYAAWSNYDELATWRARLAELSGE